MKERFIVNETDHLMPPHWYVDESRKAWERTGRKDEDFRYRDRELEVVRQRQLLERLKAKHGRT